MKRLCALTIWIKYDDQKMGEILRCYENSISFPVALKFLTGYKRIIFQCSSVEITHGEGGKNQTKDYC